jgi:Protein of unknown function (DUF992)
MRKTRSHVLSTLVLAGTCAWAGISGAAQVPITGQPGQEDPVTVLGTLTCSFTGETEGPAGASSGGTGRDVSCAFQPGQLGAEETYVGSVQGVGQTNLLFGRGAVILSVKGPTLTDFAPGLLTQRYAVDAATSGNALAPLVGESNKQIMLQPLAEEEGRVSKGKTQPEAVLIVVELKLQASPG